MLEARPYLKSIEILHEDAPKDEYPFNLPLINNLRKIDFHQDITFIVGENGSGKSTLIEAIATAWGFNAEGGNKNFSFSTENTHSSLNDYIKITKSFERPRDGYFLRAESFYNVASYVDSIPEALSSFGGKSLHEQSHGESFMAMLRNKLRGNGLYIFDEPEAALSPTKQIEALKCIYRLTRENSQFIIATHSPILLSCKPAKILQIQKGNLHEVDYLETEHFRVTRDFLNKQVGSLDINSLLD